MQRYMQILAALTLALPGAGATARMPEADAFGSSAQASAAQRTVFIGPRTKWVTVEEGEVVRFISNGQEFVWAFNGVSSSFDLKRIAPAGAVDRSLKVYVWPNPGEDR
jgi:heavy-metal resistance protein CzcE